MFPSTLQYIETVSNPDGLFNSLTNVRVFADRDEQPQFSSGNFGIVFKIDTQFGPKALKCFTRYQAGRFSAYQRIAEAIEPSRYMIDYNYIEDEIFVFDDKGEGRYYPVLLMEWVEGETLTKHIERAVRGRNTKRLALLAEKFHGLSEWLLDQTFAHNDLKPDNIMVRDGSDELVLIDYDGMFVESMAGEQAREFGTIPFQSPDRATAPFDKNVDNYSIAYIRKAMKILIDSPERFSPSALVEFSDDELSGFDEVNSIFGSHFQYLGSASGGVMIYKDDESYGFISKNGDYLTEAVFDRVQDFGEDGFAAVCSDGLWGYIDQSGEIVIPRIYNDCTPFSEGVAAVRLGEKWGFIDIAGNVLSKFVYDNAWSPRQGLALVCRKGKYGFVGLDGKIAISLKFDFAQNFTSEGVACVNVGGKYGYIDLRGKWWEKPVYDYAQNFRYGRAAVELNGREFFIEFKNR